MGNVERVKLHMQGVRELLSDSAVVADVEKRAERIAQQANDAVHTQYKIGYDAPVYVSKVTKTRKQGLPEAIVFANPRVHAGSKENPGAPLGDYAQARHSILTSAIDAGR